MDGTSKEEPAQEEPAKKDQETPNFRQLALNVSQDTTLADPFLDGEDEDNPTQSRDALIAILTKHFGYSSGEVEETGDDACRFTGKNGQPITIKTAVDSNGETCLDFRTGVGEERRIVTASLKHGVPIVFALAHQKPNQLTRIYDRRTKEPHVVDAFNIEVKQQSSGIPNTRTNIYTLQSTRLWQSASHLEGETR